MADSILYASIPELAARYRAGSLSPVQVTEACLGRIAALNSTINAFITVTAAAALAAAHQAAQELVDGHDRGLLHGIPVALKDLIDTAGVRTTCGSRILADHIPAHDAAIVAHLKAAGAVLIGKTNLLEFAYGIVHPDFGPTWNPWEPSRTAGGSSGGSAAAVAAGMCYAAVGTDTGGSIRVPAAYCGVAGFKPTYGLVSAAGVFPLAWSLDHVGPLARTCGDAALLLDALLGRRPTPLAPAPLQGLRLGVLTEHVHGAEMEPEVADVFTQVCDGLAAQGALLSDVTIPDLVLADAVLLTLIAPEAAAIHTPWITTRAEEYAPHTREQIELGFAVPGLAYVRAQQVRRHLTAHFLAALAGVDAILMPTVAWVAPFEDPVVVGEEGAAEARRTAPYNLTGLPALSVAVGLGAHGLPVGLQVVTHPGADRRALAIGAAIEARYPEVQARLRQLEISNHRQTGSLARQP